MAGLLPPLLPRCTVRVVELKVEMPLNLTADGEGCDDPVARYWVFQMDSEESEEHTFKSAKCGLAPCCGGVTGWVEVPTDDLNYDVKYFARLMLLEALKRLDQKPMVEAKLLECKEVEGSR